MSRRHKVRWQGVAGTLSLMLGFAAAASGDVVISGSLPSAGDVGMSYSGSLSATDGGDPCTTCTWSLSGTPPDSVTIDPNSGVVSGTPKVSGPFSFTVTATNASLVSGSQAFSGTINPALGINPASLPAGQQGAPYSVSISATDGTSPGPVLLSGTLPNGLTFSGGLLSGTPTQTGTFPLTASVTDSVGGSAVANYSLLINPPPPPPLTVLTNSLPSGEASAPYSASASATGGVPPYTWSIAGLPAGLTFNASNGVISGPLAANATTSTTVVLQVTDSTPTTVSSPALTLTVIAAPAVTAAALPNGEVTVAYSQTLAATGGAGPPYTWAVTTGSLPTGLSLNPTTGAITGTPTTTGPSSFTATATDSSHGFGSLGFSITVNGGPSISTSASLPQGEVGAAYSQTLIAGGGHGPYTWLVTGGSLPGGLSLSSAGVLSGTPTTLGPSSFTVQVTDSAGGTGTLAMSIKIIAGPTITTAPTLPNGTVGVAYTPVTLSASDGTGPYIWSITLGALPAGLSLNASTGTITGTPTTPTSGAASFTVQVTDAKAVTATKVFNITIAAGLTITTAPGLPGATIGVAYSTSISAAGGTPPFIWTVTIGSLPTGLTLNSSTGTISGLASSSGSFQFTVKVSDTAAVTATKQFTLNVAQSLAITTFATLPSGSVGTPYSVALSAVGGTPPYTFTVASGTVPSGLSLNPSGVITGTPVASGTFSFTVQVRDSNLVVASQPLNLTIVSGLAITTAPLLPQGAANSSYAQTLAAAGGTPPYKWSLAVGSLPAGLSLSGGGDIFGIPKANGTSTFTVQVTDHVGASANKQFTLTISAGLTITSAVLPQGTLGQAYGPFTLAQVGGSPPYTWSVINGILPGGLVLNGAVISGTPSSNGDFHFTLQVKDSTGATATQAFTITIVPPGVPQVNVAGVPPTSPAGQQISFSLSLASPYPLDIGGEVTLSFQPDAVVPAVDPALQFSTGGLTAGFTIPANTTSPVPIALQTGTVSGTITLSFALVTGGTDLPGFQSTITIPRAVPVIQSVKLVRTSAGMEIHVVGFSPSRDLTEADLTFTASPGATLQTTSVTENLSTVATAWYQSAGSTQYGSQLMLVLPFTASQGSVDAVGSVSVVLKNAKGGSAAASGGF